MIPKKGIISKSASLTLLCHSQIKYLLRKFYFLYIMQIQKVYLENMNIKALTQKILVYFKYLRIKM